MAAVPTDPHARGQNADVNLKFPCLTVTPGVSRIRIARLIVDDLIYLLPT